MEAIVVSSEYWTTPEIKLVTERKRFARRKWEEQCDSQAREKLQHMVELPPIAFEEYEKKFEDCSEIDPHGNRFALYIENSGGEFVGWISVNGIDRKNGTFSFAIGVFRDFRRKGYGTAATDMVLTYCFSELRLHKCNSKCIDINEASVRLHKKLGFRDEGVRRQCVYMHGVYHDVMLFGLTAEEHIRQTV